MKPVLQIYSLVLFDMPQFQKRKKMFQRKIERLREEAEDMEKYHKKVQQLKDKEVEPAEFAIYAYEKAIKSRQPKYEAIGEKWGVTLEADEVSNIKNSADFYNIIAQSLG